MCGIAVNFNPRGHARPLDLSQLRHRGPDASGEWLSPDGTCWLGHTRLAIVDLSPTGAQPMHDPDRGLHLVFNGEIYNSPELRAALSGAGIEWRGSSDTETLLAAFAHWGAACLGRGSPFHSLSGT